MFHYHFPERTMSLLSSNVLSGQEFEEEGTANTNDKTVPEELSRTCLLILDYKQFLAARSIQRYWRRHRTTMRKNRRDWAAVQIQRWWRGFAIRKRFVKMLEDLLHERLGAIYNKSATQIQSQYRGWIVRQTVHDAYSLRRMQQLAAEELLSCVAYRLHHLLRTKSIPGIYSLRDSSCLSKAEKLLMSTNFRFHNDRARYYQMNMAILMEERREKFKNNQYYTMVPYTGPNFNTECSLPCTLSIFGAKYLDARMYKIILEYEKGQFDEKLTKVHRTLAERKYRKHVEDMLSRSKNISNNFCGDVIRSMRKWKIWDDNKLTISDDVFRTPEFLNNFLDEAGTMLEMFRKVPCHCQIKTFDEITC